MTIFTITLEYKGKEYTYQDEITSSPEQIADNWPDEVLAEYMYEEGNYSCDCNRSLFLQWYCDVSLKDDPRACQHNERYGVNQRSIEVQDNECDEDEEDELILPCGDTIKLVSLEPRPHYSEPESAQTTYMQQENGLYLPIMSGVEQV
jgi:hypothetical protein